MAFQEKKERPKGSENKYKTLHFFGLKLSLISRCTIDLKIAFKRIEVNDKLLHEHVTYKLFEKHQMWKKSFNWRNMELDENFAKVKEHLNWQIKILSLIMFQKNKNKDKHGVIEI